MLGDIVDLFAGPRRDASAREAVLDRIAWLRARAWAGRDRGMSILIAADDRSERARLADRRALERNLADLLGSPETDHVVDVAIGDPRSDALITRDFDSVVITQEAGGPDWWRAIQAGWARARADTGRLFVIVPVSSIAPSTLVRMLRPLVSPLELSVEHRFLSFEGEKKESEFEAWRAVASTDHLRQLAEKALAEAERSASDLDKSFRSERKKTIAAIGRATRSTELALDRLLDENARLQEALDRTKSSARYRLGAAVLTAPSRLLDIYLPNKANNGTETERPPIPTALDERLDAIFGDARDLSEPPEHPIVLWVGRIDPSDAWIAFLEIGAHLRDHPLDPDLWIISGPSGTSPPDEIAQLLVDCAASFSIADRVRWFPGLAHASHEDAFTRVAESRGCLVSTGPSRASTPPIPGAIAIVSPPIDGDLEDAAALVARALLDEAHGSIAAPLEIASSVGP